MRNINTYMGIWRRWQTAIISMLLCVLLPTSCHKDPVDDEQPDYEKTILVFMPWSGTANPNNSGLYHAFQKNLNDIESAIKVQGGLGKTRLLVFISESSSTSKLYEFLYDAQQHMCTRKELNTYTGNDYTTAKGIAQILNDTRNHSKTPRYALIIGCHGTGWTYVHDWQDYPNYAKPMTGYAWPTSDRDLHIKHTSDELFDVRTRFYGSVDSSVFAAEIETLSEGIRMSGMHMQFILFDDCYMANVEVAYELRQVTDYLIASTSEIMAIGMPYADMWPALAPANPDYYGIVNSFHTYYSSYSTPCGTIAVIDCRQMEALADVMRQINNLYTFDENQLESLQILDGFNDPIFFDMGDYGQKLCGDPDLYDRFATLLNKTVVSKATTDLIYSALYPTKKYITVNTFSGITISDPSQHAVAMNGKGKTAWWKATHQTNQ